MTTVCQEYQKFLLEILFTAVVLTSPVLVRCHTILLISEPYNIHCSLNRLKTAA
jgi:hypothetical protein